MVVERLETGILMPGRERSVSVFCNRCEIYNRYAKCYLGLNFYCEEGTALYNGAVETPLRFYIAQEWTKHGIYAMPDVYCDERGFYVLLFSIYSDIDKFENNVYLCDIVADTPICNRNVLTPDHAIEFSSCGHLTNHGIWGTIGMEINNNWLGYVLHCRRTNRQIKYHEGIEFNKVNKILKRLGVE